MPPAAVLPGKDARLDQTISACHRRLQAMGLEVVTRSWRHPAPHCWSVHLHCPEFPQLYSNGKGVTRLAAQASALGEFFERLATNFFFTDSFLDDDHHQSFLFYPEEKWFDAKPARTRQKVKGGKHLLNRRLWQFYDREGELTVDLLRDHSADLSRPGIVALPFSNLFDQELVYFPTSLLNNLYLSNGMAAGNSAAEAGAQAVAEILERYAKNQIISQGISLPDIPPSYLERYPGIVETLQRLAAAGFSVRLKDGSLGGRFPVICALLCHRDSGGVFAAFGASLRFQVAIERTLSELLQGRRLSSLQHFHPPEHELGAVADPGNLESHFIDSEGLLAWSMFRDQADYPFAPWDFEGSSEMELAKLLTILKKLGATAYRAEYLHCGMYTCRFIVPGISEIYPLDDLLYNNRMSSAVLRSRLLDLPRLNRKQLIDMIEIIEEIGISEHQLLGEAIGVLFDAGSAWDSLRLGELKAMLYLATENQEQALGWCRWVIDHAALPEPRRRHYQLIHALLGFALAGQTAADFHTTLSQRHHQQEIAEAEAVVCGRIRFFGLGFARSWSALSTRHRQFLELYRRLNLVKQNGLP